MSGIEELAAEAVTERASFQGPEIGPVVFPGVSATLPAIRCHETSLQLNVAGQDGTLICIGMRLDQTALAYYPTADQARRLAATLLRAADLIDGGRSKQ